MTGKSLCSSSVVGTVYVNILRHQTKPISYEAITQYFERVYIPSQQTGTKIAYFLGHFI